MEIKSWITGELLYSGEAESLSQLVNTALKAGANLAGANLAGANLAGANLAGANLAGAYLARAYLAGANLARANLARANLDGANLARANLYGANLYGANLDGAYLYGANLYGANLYGANLAGANLAGANLDGANLYGANLDGANLAGAYLDGQHFFQIAGVGSAKRFTTYWAEADEIRCGYFIGTMENFKSKVNDRHEKKSRHNAEYMAAISFFKTCVKLIPKDEAKLGRELYAKMKEYKWEAPK